MDNTLKNAERDTEQCMRFADAKSDSILID